MSANRKLAYNVHIEGEDGDMHVFGPDSDVPAWARKKITNPSAWEDGSTEPEPEPAPAVPATGSGGDTPPPPPVKETYTASEWTKAKLTDEVEARNAGRADDDKIEVEGPGNKPELQAALVADDAVQADPDA